MSLKELWVTYPRKLVQRLCKDQGGKSSKGGRSQKLARYASYQSTIDIYRHLLPNQLEKGLHELDLALLSVERMN